MDREDGLRQPPSLAPEHDWAAASRVVRPSLRPYGTTGIDGRDVRVPAAGGGPGKPLVGAGPAGIPIVYVIPADGFEILVGVEHLLSWAVGPEEVHAAAIANLTAWSATAPWTEEVEDGRHLIWSDAGEGCDAARILLEEVRAQLRDDLPGAARVVVGLPERDLLIAAAVEEDDDEFVSLFADYVAERAAAADEPIAAALFELVDGELVRLRTLTAA